MVLRQEDRWHCQAGQAAVGGDAAGVAEGWEVGDLGSEGWPGVARPHVCVCVCVRVSLFDWCAYVSARASVCVCACKCAEEAHILGLF